MKRLGLAVLAAFALAGAGCIGSPSGDDEPGRDDGADWTPTGSAGPRPPPTGPEPGSSSPAPPPGDNGSQAGENRSWVEPAAAAIRPGASLDGGDCTANFVFTSLDNRIVYLGTAAHCFSTDGNTQTDGCAAGLQPLNTTVEVQGAGHPAKLAYSSWSAMQEAGEADSGLCDGNDFALLELHPDDANATSPALEAWGGPTGVADGGSTGDKVLSYGNSGLRPRDSALSPREGYVVLPGPRCDTRVLFTNPAIPGDSGSPVLLGDGQALGVFVSIELAPLPGMGHVCLLGGMLGYAAAHGMPVRLAAWKQLDDGLLPPV